MTGAAMFTNAKILIITQTMSMSWYLGVNIIGKQPFRRPVISYRHHLRRSVVPVLLSARHYYQIGN